MIVRYDNEAGMYFIRPIENIAKDIQVTPDQAIELVKLLYSQGLEFDMPSADSYIQGKLEATEKHLDDMRRLVMMENEEGKV